MTTNSRKPIQIGAFTSLLFALGIQSAYATPFTLSHTVDNPVPTVGERFSYSVDVSGGTAIIGAPEDENYGSNTGGVYLVDTATGNVNHSLLPSTPIGRDRFGWSVGIDGSLAIVGAPLRDGPGSDAGGAFIYDTTNGNLVSTLDNIGVGGAQFGRSVDISGSLAVAGAPFANSNDSGAAYVFDALTGNLLNILINPLNSAGDQFGFEVAIDGNLIAVSSRLEDVGATDAGAVHVFDAITGNLVTSLFDPNPAANDLFGFALDIDDGKVLVGAPYDDHLETDSGRAFIYDALTGDLLETLNNPTPNNGDQFGTSVDLSGEVAVVGAYLDDPLGVNSAGSAYIFDSFNGDLLQSIANPFPENDDFFSGFSTDGLAVDGGTLVVGASFDDTAATNAGQAYIYESEFNQLEEVPTPGALALLGLGVLGVAARRRTA